MTQTKSSTAGVHAKKSRPEPLHIMVLQRCSPGLRPGPIHVVKKVLKDVEVGSTVKKCRVPVTIEYSLPAGTGALTAADKRAFADEGLSAREIAYVEDKLPEKKARSDAHQAAFEAEEATRLKKKLTKRLIAQLSADPELAAGVIAALEGSAAADSTMAAAPTTSNAAVTLSDKISSLRTLLDEVGGDIEAYKEAAKVGKYFDKDKLRAMLSEDAERDWKLCWFAFSRMIDQAVRTPFARKNGWASDPELSQLATAHGYKAGVPETTRSGVRVSIT
ncbi:hypothetical protein [Rhizobacter sp. SG703]|uniref:hypothetical protein n=1 Tax=Rhizobacter sp. SG703 TaxID=2587140 RepID=UPI001445CC34|nr:hypothetical protein [Rhizobacter sp. SG703]NKI93893.1 hypothetical protein [Rhizobacter sp. SG703]